MTKADLVKRLRKWEYDWTHYLNISLDDSFGKGAERIREFTLFRLRQLITEANDSD